MPIAHQGMTLQARHRWLAWASAVLAIVAFAIDVRFGRVLAGELLYVVPPLLGFWSSSRRHAWLAGTIVTVLAILAFVVQGDTSGSVLADRALCLAAVWTTVALCLAHERDVRAIVAQKAIGQSYLDIADVLITVLRPDETVVLVNPKGCELLGCGPADLLADNGLDRMFPAEARAEARRLLRGLVEGAAPNADFEGTLAGEGGRLRRIQWHWAAVRDERGQVLYLIGSGTDVTGRRQAEDSLVGQAALTRLGEMSLMVAHEVKNPLAGLRGAIQVLGERLSTDPAVRSIVERAFRSIDGLTALVDDLVVFARPGLPTRGSVEVLSLLRDVATSLEKDPKLAEGRVSVSGVAAVVSGDARLLRQAFLNLLINAAEAGGARGEVRVRVASVGTGCRVEIEDRGPGIPAEKRAMIFEPFYSTKAHGSGLGLSIARRVVTLHDGEIQVECPAQCGTTMIVTLP